MMKVLNVWVILLNVVLAIAASVTINTMAFGYTAVIATIILVVGVACGSALHVLDGRRMSGRVLASLWGTALIWIAVLDAPGFGESTLIQIIVDGSLVLGCILLIGSAVWPRDSHIS